MSQTPIQTSAVTLQNCDSEPIHIPGAIQPVGALIALDRAQVLVYMSENAEDLLGVTLALGETFDCEALPINMATRVCRWMEEADPDFEPFQTRILGRDYDVVGHRNVDDVMVIEMELHGGDQDALTPSFNRAYQTIQSLRRQRSVDSLLRVAVDEIRSITGFDRVMAYRFHQDDSGEVVKESRRHDLDDWEGRRYPASDIPAQARRLYIKNTLRLIVDATYSPIRILACPSLGGKPLDLSASILRSVSPIHLEYMANMGVRASMSISVVIEGRLWGMIACHHLSPCHVPYGVRMACEVVAQILSTTIATFDAQQRAQKIQEATALVGSISTRVRGDDDILAALTRDTPTPASLVDHDSCLCIWAGGHSVCDGIAPRGDMRDVVRALNATNSRLVACTSIARDFPDLQSVFVPYAGFLACCFDPVNNGWIIWLRREQIETLVWGGYPEKRYTHGANGPRLTPRGSFDEWRETVRGTCTAWLPSEEAAAENLRDELGQIANSRSAEMDRARTGLLAMLGHDLRDPLQSISVAAQLLLRSDGKGAKMGARIRTSSDRMQRLISQVLDLSRIQGGLGLGIQPARTDLAPLIQDLVEEMRLAQSSITIEAEIAPELIAVVDADRLAQVVSNLLSNAGKHGVPGTPIRVRAFRENGTVRIKIVNLGGPLSPSQLESLFSPFKPHSLGQDRNRNGLGLGLYIADQVVRDHGGELTVVCEAGEVDFTVTLPAASTDIAPELKAV